MIWSFYKETPKIPQGLSFSVLSSFIKRITNGCSPQSDSEIPNLVFLIIKGKSLNQMRRELNSAKKKKPFSLFFFSSVFFFRRRKKIEFEMSSSSCKKVRQFNIKWVLTFQPNKILVNIKNMFSSMTISFLFRFLIN